MSVFKEVIKSLGTLLEKMLPGIITKYIKSWAIQAGLGISGFGGMILGLVLKYVSKWAVIAAKEEEQKIVDKINDEKYKEVINDPKATDAEKIKDETSILNGN